jgi:hypothetical protein
MSTMSECATAQTAGFSASPNAVLSPAARSWCPVRGTAPGDVGAITPQHAPWRTNEYALFASGAVAKWCAALGIEPIDYRDIQRLWLRDRDS